MTDSKYKEKIVDIKLTENNSGEEAPIDFVVSETDSKDQPSPSPENLESKAFDTTETPPDLGPRYDILGLVGTGGMGTVWKVHDKELNEDFAIKVLKPELVTDETALKRFQKEANLASELTHANIAAIFGPGEDGSGRPYIIMRYVDGESLADILKREGKLSEERAMDIFSQLCEALSHSHMKGIVHRDIKPSNIIISKTESGADLVQLVDFGIARCVYDEVTKTQALTKAVDVFGSPRYMSPEQLLGQEVTGQSDIYSLGIVLYEMLTGAPPFTADNPVELIMQQIQQDPELTEIPENIVGLLTECLVKNSKERLSNIGTLAEKLNQNKSLPMLPNPDWRILLAITTILNVLVCSRLFTPVPAPMANLFTLFMVGFILNLTNRQRKIEQKGLVQLEFFANCNVLLLLIVIFGLTELSVSSYYEDSFVRNIGYILLSMAGYILIAWKKPQEIYCELAYKRIELKTGIETRRLLRRLVPPSAWYIRHLVGGYTSFSYGLLLAIPIMLWVLVPKVDHSPLSSPAYPYLPVPLIFSFATMLLSSALVIFRGKHVNLKSAFKDCTKLVTVYLLAGILSGACVLNSIQNTGIIAYFAREYSNGTIQNRFRLNNYLLHTPDSYYGNLAKLATYSHFVPVEDSVTEATLLGQSKTLQEQILQNSSNSPPALRAEAELNLARIASAQNCEPSIVNQHLIKALDYLVVAKEDEALTPQLKVGNFFLEKAFPYRHNVYKDNYAPLEKVIQEVLKNPNRELLIKSELQLQSKQNYFSHPYTRYQATQLLASVKTALYKLERSNVEVENKPK